MSKKKKNKSQNNIQIQKKKQKKQAQAIKNANIISQTEADKIIQKTSDLPDEAAVTDIIEEIPEQESEQICENTETESADIATENNETDEHDTNPDSGNEEATDTINLPKIDYIAVLKERMDDIWNFISETRKISVPLIILVYTAIIVSITIPIEHARVLKQLQQDASEFEEITNTESSITTLEKNFQTELASGSTVVYTGFEFTDTVKGENSDEFGSTYENDSEANTYLDVVLEYTHNNETPVPADKIAAMTAKTGNSQYASFAAVETDDGKNIEFANNIEISSGETVKIHYIFNVPKELQTNEKNLVVDVAIDKNVYNINIK